VSVEERLVRYAQAVARRFEEIDQPALLDRIEAAIQAAGHGHGLVSRGGGATSGATPPGREADTTGESSAQLGLAGGRVQELHRQFDLHEEKGDNRSALQIALLLEGLDCEKEAEGWWYRAAGLGNLDAIDYVTTYLLPVVQDIHSPGTTELPRIEVSESAGLPNMDVPSVSVAERRCKI